MLNVRDAARAWRAVLKGVILALVLLPTSKPVYAAFTPAASPLLSAAAVTPNLMLLVDDSGSMNSLIRAADFNQSASWPQIYSYTCNFIFCGYTPMAMGDENLLLGNINGSTCLGAGYYGFRTSTNGTTYCLKLPDPVGNGDTRYSVRYISYLISKMSGTSKDYTDNSIPNDYRINVARNAATAIVTANRALRIGLATFNSPMYISRDTVDYGNGGYIAKTITDLQATPTTTAAQATTNYNALITAIRGLGAVANTPLAESYYEVTRYFRGLDSYYNDGVSYSSPIQYRCQKNYGVVITDGLPTYDRSFPGSDPAYVAADVGKGIVAQRLPNWDNKSSNDGNNLQGDGEGDTLYLDDVAKFAYDIDMRKASSTDLDGAKKSWDEADFPKQNMLTYSVGFTATNQMLADAASYGHGGYYQANDANTLATALSTALSNINSKAGSGGAGSSNASTLSNSTTYFQTLYDPTDWRGIIRAYPYNTDGTIGTALTWTTDNTIVPGAAGTVFQSYNGTAPITLSYGNFSNAQKDTLNANLPTGVNGNHLVEWSKGINRTGLRTRSVLLGDIINSPLTYASPTDQTAANTATDNTYTAYLNTKASSMSASLVVNGNDGFTNVINPATGVRRYAYLPSSALPLLYTVADVNYVSGTSHTFLNDGQITIADVQPAKGSASWKTVAFSGVGASGKTFSAIQLFDSAGNNAPSALWEISAPAPANSTNTLNDLGYAYAKPEVARMPDGTWAAFIANGYGSASGKAALYVVNALTGAVITKLVVDNSETDNGLSSVKLRVDATGTVVAAYGGDLKGRLWKFDLSNTAYTSWGVAFSGKPLFTAPGAATQPITAQPLVVSNTASGRMIYFGTGKFNEILDKTSTTVQGFYAVLDAEGGTGNYSVTNLVRQSITGSFAGTGGAYMTTSANSVDYTSKFGWYLPLTYGTTLVGERVITQAYYTLGRILFTTAGVDTADPCSSQGFGRLVVLDALSGGMLTTAVLDTNGDNLVSSTDAVSSGRIYSSGIPTLTAVVKIAGDAGSADLVSLAVGLSDGTIDSQIMKGGGAGGRIMWRQIQ
jgi:type IV pilus assembly protein PilY1